MHGCLAAFTEGGFYRPALHDGQVIHYKRTNP
jgi:hypothetical protein